MGGYPRKKKEYQRPLDKSTFVKVLLLKKKSINEIKVLVQLSSSNYLCNIVIRLYYACIEWGTMR